VLIWTVLPPGLRRRTRPVAGADYWLKGPFRRFFGRKVFNAVLIERNPKSRKDHPISALTDVLDTGASLILFPEGTRNMTDQPLLPFKNGLHHLAKARPGIDLVPVWIDNLNRVLPKGEMVPIPLICTVTFGAPIHFDPEESREVFATRAETALLSLKPKTAGEDL
ncbi:MAG: lysophospholipid acyltransferase family protein, partial [Geminicoccaceae bacterium]